MCLQFLPSNRLSAISHAPISVSSCSAPVSSLSPNCVESFIHSTPCKKMEVSHHLPHRLWDSQQNIQLGVCNFRIRYKPHISISIRNSYCIDFPSSQERIRSRSGQLDLKILSCSNKPAPRESEVFDEFGGLSCNPRDQKNGYQRELLEGPMSSFLVFGGLA